MRKLPTTPAAIPPLNIPHTAKGATTSTRPFRARTSASEIAAIASEPITAIAGSVSMSSDSHRAVHAPTGTAASQDLANSARLSARRRAIMTALPTAARPAHSGPCKRSHLSGGAVIASAQNKTNSTPRPSSTARVLTPARERRLRRINLAAASRGALTREPLTASCSPGASGRRQSTLGCKRGAASRTRQPPLPPRRFAPAASHKHDPQWP